MAVNRSASGFCADAMGVFRRHEFSAARLSPHRTMVGAKRRGRRADWRPRARLRARRDFDRQRKGRA